MKKLILLFITLIIFACSTEPKEINYGNDKCDYCTMTIVDKPYGTELVTNKGKVYKFDSVECMLNFIDANANTYAHVLTNAMDKPGELLKAQSAFYLVSENLPSPMGGNITAFSTKILAEEAQAEYKGAVYDFEELKQKLKQINQNAAHPQKSH